MKVTKGENGSASGIPLRPAAALVVQEEMLLDDRDHDPYRVEEVGYEER